MTQFDELGNEVLTPEQQEQENRERFDFWWRIPKLTRDEVVQILAGVEPLLSWHDEMRNRYLPHAFDGENASRKAMDKRTRDDSFDADIEAAEWHFRSARYAEPRSLEEWLKCAEDRGLTVPWQGWIESYKGRSVLWWYEDVTAEKALAIAQSMPRVEGGKDDGSISVSGVAKSIEKQINLREREERTDRSIGWKSILNRMIKLGITDQIKRL
jgi:hypothetical protein